MKGDRLISLNAAIDALGEEPLLWEAKDDYTLGQLTEWRRYKEALEALPSAQQERKKGRWIDIDAETYTWKIRCDQCGHERSMLSTGQTYPRFCENCGSDMRGDSNG